MRRRIDSVLVLVLASMWGGCSRSVPDPSFTLDAARTFQAEHVAQLRDLGSPLAVIDAEYLGPSQRIVLGREGKGVVRNDEQAADPITLEVDAAGLHCRQGCPPEVLAMDPIDASHQFAWGPLYLRLTPQPVDGEPGGRVLVIDPNAPALKGPKPTFFPVTGGLIVHAKFEPGSGETASLTTSRGVSKPFARAGVLRFEVGGKSASLQAFRGVGTAAGPLLVPFTDPTNETTSYPVGRYLEVHVDGDGATLDFNRATNPWCAYSPHFNCPVPPRDNALETPINAGERLYPKH